MLVNRETRGPEAAEGRMTAATACRTCGTEPLKNARFCHGCGSPLDEADTRAEYKQVTVLFVDVVHRPSLGRGCRPAHRGARPARPCLRGLVVTAADVAANTQLKGGSMREVGFFTLGVLDVRPAHQASRLSEGSMITKTFAHAAIVVLIVSAMPGLGRLAGPLSRATPPVPWRRRAPGSLHRRRRHQRRCR